MSDSPMSDKTANALVQLAICAKRTMIANQRPDLEGLEPLDLGRSPPDLAHTMVGAASHAIVGEARDANTMVRGAAHTIAGEGGHPDFDPPAPTDARARMIFTDAGTSTPELIFQELRGGLGIGRTHRRPQPQWTVRCPSCFAAEGHPCVTIIGHVPRITGHARRRELEALRVTQPGVSLGWGGLGQSQHTREARETMLEDIDVCEEMAALHRGRARRVDQARLATGHRAVAEAYDHRRGVLEARLRELAS